MKLEDIIKKLGKKQRLLLKILNTKVLDYFTATSLNHIVEGLLKMNLVEIIDDSLKLSSLGREAVEKYQKELFQDSIETTDEILNRLLGIKPDKKFKLKKREYLFLCFLAESSYGINEIRNAKNIIPSLEEKFLIVVANGVLSITEIGKDLLINSPKTDSNENPTDIFLAAGKIEARRDKQAKAEIFLSLYRQGLTYQEIGDLYEITRERVRQILNVTPNFQQYLEEYEKARIQRELNKEKDSKFRELEKSLAFQFSDRIDELWDWEKNGELNPAKIPAHSANYEIWLRCPKDNHSWKKKPCDIVTSWVRSKTSGCPICVGKINKAQKQKTLVEVYPEFIDLYWDFEKNNVEGSNPYELTLGSNRKVWLKCPIDNNSWLAFIAATVNQQWSKGNAGCRVCNGTDSRNDGVWGKALTVQEKFPEQVVKFWDFEKNAIANLKPEEITSGSSKEAWFKCPIAGHKWQAKIAAISNSWSRGSSGCPFCRGFLASESNSLASTYPKFVSRFWDFEKNSKLNLKPENLTCGTNREAWFRCPMDGTQWNSKINHIVKSFWKVNKSGCPKCGRNRKTINHQI